MENIFEKQVKEKMHWTFGQWQQNGMAFEGMKRLVNSMKYWHGRLRNAQKAKNVIFTLFGGSSRIYPSLQETALAIHGLNKDIEIVGYSKFKNKRYLGLSFKDIETREFIINNLLSIQGYSIAYLHWVSEEIQTTIRVEWLSYETDLDITMEYINKYMDIKSVHRERTMLQNGVECSSGTVIFKGEIFNNIQLDNIPHFDSINGLECLITVDGRALKCYTCLQIGHKASSCAKAFCNNCKRLLNKSHICARLKSDTVAQAHAKFSVNGNASVLDSNTEDCFTNLPNKCLEKPKDQNLFLHNKLNFPESLSQTMEQANNDLIIADEEVGRRVDWTVKGDTMQNNMFGGSTQLFSSNNTSSMKTDPYIIQEVSRGDPNFVLVDTSSEESSDVDDNADFIFEADKYMAELNSCVDISRSFLDNSKQLLGEDLGKTTGTVNQFKGVLSADTLNSSLSSRVTRGSERNEEENKPMDLLLHKPDNTKFKKKKERGRRKKR